MGRVTYEMEELVPIVAELSERYTAYESTSITYEKANQLMGAVLYCIHEYERSGEEGASGSLVTGEITAREAYQSGFQLVNAKVRAMKELYHGLIRDFRYYGNIALRDTVDAIPEFLKWYDVRYAPQDTILTLDYPLLVDSVHCIQREPGGISAHERRYTGIDAVYEYIKCICIEQRFLNRFPETYVTQVLCGYEEMFENICGILLADVVWHLVLKKQFDGMGIMESDRSRIQAVLGMYPLEEAKDLARRMVKDFVLKFYGNDDEMWQYLSGECGNIVVRMMHSAV